MKNRVFCMFLAQFMMLALFPIAVLAETESGPEVKALAGPIKQVSMGCTHSAALDADGSLWTWGANSVGELGDGTTNYHTTPIKIMDEVANISLGTSHSAAIKTDGSLWTWGSNDRFTLGDGTQQRHTSPEKIMDDVMSISMGWDHSAAIKQDSSLWTWGANDSGQLGDGTFTSRSKPVKVLDSVSTVSTGIDYSAAIKLDGSLWTWGHNPNGRLGDGTTNTHATPVKIMDEVLSVSLKSSHMAAVKTDGTLWTWGDNYFGQLGDGTDTTHSTPVKIMDDVIDVSVGRIHSAAIKKDGSLWTWGNNEYGQLGDGTTTNRSTPVKIMENVVAVSMGDFGSAAIKTDGSLWTWGSNEYCQLGDGTTIISISPLQIVRPSSDSVMSNFEELLQTNPNSYQYDLACIAANLSMKTYQTNDSAIRRYLMNDLGFTTDKHPIVYSNNYGGSLAFTVATADYAGYDADKVLIIAAQGSTNPYELIKDATALSKSYYRGYAVYDIVQDFYNAINEGLGHVLESGKRYKVLVTGHSLGGAAANLAAASLVDYGLLDAQCISVYCYTFGAINTIATNAPVKRGHECIHNIYNLLDTFSPYQFGLLLPTGMGRGYGKFGVMESFIHDWRSDSDRSKAAVVQVADHINHDMDKYLEAVESHRVEAYVNSAYSVLACPVDVDVFCGGKLVGRVVNHEVDTAVTTLDIQVEDEVIFILYPDGQTYDLKIASYDEGSMTFSAFSPNGSEQVKTINDIALDKGKTMVSEVAEDITASETQLFVMDADEEIVSKIREDGTESEIDRTAVHYGYTEVRNCGDTIEVAAVVENDTTTSVGCSLFAVLYYKGQMVDMDMYSNVSVSTNREVKRDFHLVCPAKYQVDTENLTVKLIYVEPETMVPIAPCASLSVGPQGPE